MSATSCPHSNRPSRSSSSRAFEVSSMSAPWLSAKVTSAGSASAQMGWYRDDVQASTAVRSTINEFVHGHGMRRCRYRSRDRAHVQHVLTAIAINIERISAQAPGSPKFHPRQPTAFQNYLDHRGFARPRRWRATV
ncbi:transposase [Streptomyces sp. HUAS TT7]|uniref:transposase n=1 Tax=Streptomyces sp. HUAS TT7 TaxID=3447507 RepID=UPI003F65DBFC